MMQSIPDNWRFVVLDREILEMGLSVRERVVYAQLLLHSLDRKRVVMINYPQMMDECEIKSRTTLAKVIKQLEERGLIKVERSKARGSKTTVNKYTVLPVSGTENGLLTESSSTENGLLTAQDLEASSPLNGLKKRVNKNTSDPDTRQQEDRTLTSTDTNVSTSGQSVLLGGFTKPSTGKPTKMQRALDKIDLAHKTGDWAQIKDQDWTCYFISEHNKTMPRALTMSATSGWETAVFRDNFMKAYNVPRNNDGIWFIKTFIQKYRSAADPKYRDQINFNVFSSMPWLADDIAQRVLDERARLLQEERKRTQVIVDRVF